MDEDGEKESEEDRDWHDSIPGSSVDDEEEEEEKPDLIPDPDAQEAWSKVGCPSKVASQCKAVTEVYAKPSKTFDEEQEVDCPTSAFDNGEAKKGNRKQRLASSPLEEQSPRGNGVDESICHQCCGDGVGSDDTIAGATEPKLQGIQNGDDSADSGPKTFMPDYANSKATVLTREVIQSIPGSWPDHLEGKSDGGTSSVKDQDQGDDGADIPLTTGDLGLLRAFRRLFI